MSVSELTIRLCPRCHGDPRVQSKCVECEGLGLVDQSGDPFVPPPPFDSWTPQQLAELSAASERRSQPPRDSRPARLTLSQIVERQLHALSRGQGEHSSVELIRNAKGDTQVRVSVRTGEANVETVEQARMKATEQYDHLCKLYPTGSA